VTIYIIHVGLWRAGWEDDSSFTLSCIPNTPSHLQPTKVNETGHKRCLWDAKCSVSSAACKLTVTLPSGLRTFRAFSWRTNNSQLHLLPARICSGLVRTIFWATFLTGSNLLISSVFASVRWRVGHVNTQVKWEIHTFCRTVKTIFQKFGINWKTKSKLTFRKQLCGCWHLTTSEQRPVWG